MRNGLKAAIRLVLFLGAVVFVTTMTIGCGREYPAQPECYAVIGETLFVEPGHKPAGYVIERRCSDVRPHTRFK
jgi:hypothetical protein